MVRAVVWKIVEEIMHMDNEMMAKKLQHQLLGT